MGEVDSKVELQLARIKGELYSAMILHPPICSDHHAYAMILEELEEYWEHVKINSNKLDEIECRRRIAKMQDELLKIAAMCIRATIDCNLMG